MSLLASECRVTRSEYRPLLEQRGADIVMIDPTWTGGITDSRKIASMAEAYNLPVTMHHCTGPFTLFASIHLALSASNAGCQETVHCFLAPTDARLGTAVLPGVAARPGVTVVESTAT